MRVLLLEDDTKIATFIREEPRASERGILAFSRKGLEKAHFAVDHIGDGEEGLHFAIHEPYDAVIIDIMLPELDGQEIIKMLRERNINAPVLILGDVRGSWPH